MKWASLMVDMAVGLTFLGTGCQLTELGGLLFLRQDPLTGDRVLVGSMDAVAFSTQTSLNKLGLKAKVTPGSEKYVIESETAKGVKFQLVLTRVESSAGEKTRVKLEWVDNRPDHTGVSILTEVEKTHTAPPATK